MRRRGSAEPCCYLDQCCDKVWGNAIAQNRLHKQQHRLNQKSIEDRIMNLSLDFLLARSSAHLKVHPHEENLTELMLTLRLECALEGNARENEEGNNYPGFYPMFYLRGQLGNPPVALPPSPSPPRSALDQT